VQNARQAAAVGKGSYSCSRPTPFAARLLGQAIRRLTLAARKHFTGVRVLPLPIANGGAGTVDALLTACNGTGRTVQIRGPQDEKIEARYAVLRGSTAVIEMPEAFAAQGVPRACIAPASAWGSWFAARWTKGSTKSSSAWRTAASTTAAWAACARWA
jgi:hypothetical protein